MGPPGLNMQTTVWVLGLYFAAVLAVVAGMIGISYLLGQRHKDRATGEPYESGVLTTGSARVRFSVKFYLVALLFVVFDLETVFIVAWAVAFRQLGWGGYAAIVVFIAVLFVALVYLWRLGALDFGPANRKRKGKLPSQ